MTSAEQASGWTGAAVAGLAALAHAVRPDWDEAGIAATVRQLRHLPVAAVTVALIRGAGDSANETPAALLHLNNRAWDGDEPPPCPRHPHDRRWRIDGECRGCYVDRRADEQPTIRDRGGRPVPREARQLITTALHRR